MSHNPHAQQASAALSATTAGALPRFALSGHRVIALSGRDAVAFAQAQSMNDVDGLPVGRWQWNGWLTPKGRVIALFLLVRVAADQVWLVVPDTDAEAAVRWAAADLRLGLARLPPSQAEQWTPQMLSLERLHAYSVKKGCYPGQEIVARTHFLGQAKRGLVLFEAAQDPGVGTNVDIGATALGQVVSIARNGEGFVVLAVLPAEHADAPITANGIALRQRALLGGLAR